jgi:hypothetical protein
LNTVNYIENNFALVDIDYDIFETAISCVSSPDAKI